MSRSYRHTPLTMRKLAIVLIAIALILCLTACDVNDMTIQQLCESEVVKHINANFVQIGVYTIESHELKFITDEDLPQDYASAAYIITVMDSEWDDDNPNSYCFYEYTCIIFYKQTRTNRYAMNDDCDLDFLIRAYKPDSNNGAGKWYDFEGEAEWGNYYPLF